MAVKVMFAPAIAQRAKVEPQPAKRASETKPRRRRSSVFDADGNEVFITIICLKCQKMRPLAQFGLRRMADGAIRNQPWCRTCRSGFKAAADPAPSSNKKRKSRSDKTRAHAPTEPAGQKVVDPGSIAAQVVAALHGGRR